MIFIISRCLKQWTSAVSIHGHHPRNAGRQLQSFFEDEIDFSQLGMGISIGDSMESANFTDDLGNIGFMMFYVKRCAKGIQVYVHIMHP